MIIEARNFAKNETIDVAINPVNVLLQMAEDWRASIGVAFDAQVKAGYWSRKQGSRIRLATREEIEQNNSFFVLLTLASELHY